MKPPAKKILPAILTAFALKPAFVLALTPSFPCPPGLRCVINSGNGISEINALILTAINALLGIAFGLSVLFVIIGGFKLIISGGNQESAEKAKSGIINSIIGLVLILLSYVLLQAIVNMIAGNSTGVG